MALLAAFAALAGTASALHRSTQARPTPKPLPAAAWRTFVANAKQVGMILKQAPHRAAAQLLANYMQSPAGQAILNAGFGAIYPNLPGTVYPAPRVQRLNDFTKAKVDAFNAQWTSLFTH